MHILNTKQTNFADEGHEDYQKYRFIPAGSRNRNSNKSPIEVS